jgi:hypothetical protein
MRWYCGELNCQSHPNADDRCPGGRWYCGCLWPICPGHPNEAPCPAGTVWHCGGRACPTHSQASHTCSVGPWRCGRDGCLGHRSPNPSGWCDPEAALLFPDWVLAFCVLGPLVQGTSHWAALPYACMAYYNFREAHPDQIQNPNLYFVDLGLGNRVRRGWVLDMADLTLVDGPFSVAHGRGSSNVRNAVPMLFSNVEGTAASSLGLYRTLNTYAYSGHSNGQAYHSIGLRLDGMSGSFNNNAMHRGVVVHGAPYVTANDAGKSEGCPAMEQHRAHSLIPLLAGGAVVFVFSSNDAAWRNGDPWVHRYVAGAH